MRSMNLAEIRLAVNGRWHATDASERMVHGVSNDTRTVKEGDLYVAIRGERFDGHAFLADAAAKGAAGALIEAAYNGPVPENLPCIMVGDTRRALGMFASHYRKQAVGTCVVSVAGSNGKTTTREMIAAVLAQRGETIRNKDNHNNDIGVPQTIFDIEARTRFAVIELGTNHPGELDCLAGMVEPDIAVLTSIGEEHLEGFGDIEGVMREEAAIFRGMKADGVAIVNYDNRYCVRAREEVKGRVVSFGFDQRCEIRGQDIVFDQSGAHFRVNGRHAFRLPMLGEHNVRNALAAIACGWVCGVDVAAMQAALANFKPVGKRMEVEHIGGAIVLNDCYNANPASMRAALATINDFKAKGRRIVALGDMFELGGKAALQHEMLGWYVRTKQVDMALCVGPLMRLLGQRVEECGIPTLYFDDATQAGEALAGELKAGDVLLVKGSRGMKMEKLIEVLTQRMATSSPDAPLADSRRM
ncbi:MAG: UDP-N-acetylmuramoyl-tripeptide--D-alanyl-D-alanine ligase [Planctomycetes bacterium]|nr:UDP-N-acetylmuramoyl-tripeptide--D-alanyl-D-alanine ligase [Planctomycetota bacterium]NUQ33609.1 UDP-N-acetylmuramoyl-tripeptide--D-alanyl-D-alanine ligase [Planctomycetaceae bacterium]